MEGNAPRVSAAALRNRGRVVTSGHGVTWSAFVTEAGREYLRRVRGPIPPVPRQGNVSVSAQLVDEVIAAGGVLRIPRRRERRRPCGINGALGWPTASARRRRASGLSGFGGA